LFNIHNNVYYDILDKFDQFWSENKKLMEPSDGIYFKYIPVHFYRHGSSVMTQTLVKPTSDDGNLLLLGELLKQNYPTMDNRKFIATIYYIYYFFLTKKSLIIYSSSYYTWYLYS